MLNKLGFILGSESGRQIIFAAANLTEALAQLGSSLISAARMNFSTLPDIDDLKVTISVLQKRKFEQLRKHSRTSQWYKTRRFRYYSTRLSSNEHHSAKED